MRKFSLLIVIFGLLIVVFAFVLPVNKYGFEGSLDCDGPLRSMIFLTFVVVSLKIPEIYREFQLNQECES